MLLMLQTQKSSSLAYEFSNGHTNSYGIYQVGICSVEYFRLTICLVVDEKLRSDCVGHRFLSDHNEWFTMLVVLIFHYGETFCEVISATEFITEHFSEEW